MASRIGTRSAATKKNADGDAQAEAVGVPTRRATESHNNYIEIPSHPY